MKTLKNDLLLILAVASLGAGAVGHAQAPVAPVPTVPPATGNAPAPKIQFEMPVYDFVKIKAGEPVKYTFVFTNVGTAPLEITAVRPGCGCTTAGDWSKKVEPGQTGTIPIQVNTANFSGPVTKMVNVDCNDKAQPTIVLQIKGTIWKPIDVNPQFAVLNIPPDDPGTAATIVRIMNNLDDPITLSAPESNNRSFKGEIKTIQPGKEFQLVVTAVPPLSPGNVQGQISVKTSSTNMPVLNVTAWANVQPAVTVNPPAITLPPGPLASKASPVINFQNHSTNLLQLSDATLTAKDVVPLADTTLTTRDVAVKLTEGKPGQMYTAMLTFPEGYEIPQGQQVEFSIKSNLPQFPVIKVPVTQMPHPVKPPVVPVKPGPSAQIPLAPPPIPVAGH